LFDTFGSEVNPISSEIPSETEREDLRKIQPKKEKEKKKVQAHFSCVFNLPFFVEVVDDFSCLSKGTVIQDAIASQMPFFSCPRTRQKRHFDKRSQTPTEKKVAVRKNLPSKPLFFNSLVDPMSSRAGSIQPHFFKTGLGTPHTRVCVCVVFGCFERAESFTVTSADIPEGHIEPFCLNTKTTKTPHKEKILWVCFIFCFHTPRVCALCLVRTHVSIHQAQGETEKYPKLRREEDTNHFRCF